MGGAVSRNLAHHLYGGNKSEHDFDFMVEKISDEIKVPKGCQYKENRFGNPKIVSDHDRIDIFPITNIEAIKRYGIEATIENFLKITPLTIQSLVYDVKEEILIGDKGIESLKTKKIKINDPEEAKLRSAQKEMSVEEFVKHVANSMGFEAVLE